MAGVKAVHWTSRLLIGLALAFSALAPVAAQAQAKHYRIGIINYAAPMGRPGEAPDPGGGKMPVKDALAKYGYVEGGNTTYHFLSAGRDLGKMDQLARDMVAWKPDVILTLMSNAGLYVMHATANDPVPVVFWATDPLEEGLIKSYMRPGKNFTGFSYEPGYALKQMRVLKILKPNLKKVAHLYNHTYSPAPSQRREIIEAGRWMGIEVKTYEVMTKEGLEPAFAQMKKDGMEAVSIGPHEVFNTNGPIIGPLSLKYGLPTMGCCQMSIVQNGGTAAFGPPDGWPAMAERVDMILQGRAKVGDIPVLRMAPPMMLNLKSVKALGLTAPDYLIDEADRLIQ